MRGSQMDSLRTACLHSCHDPASRASGYFFLFFLPLCSHILHGLLACPQTPCPRTPCYYLPTYATWPRTSLSSQVSCLSRLGRLPYCNLHLLIISFDL